MTFSIVARDPVTGALGVATATAGPAVGALVPHVVSGVGAAATQAMTNPYLAFDGLGHLAELGAERAAALALEADAERDRRQFIIIDAGGGVTGWTGQQCDAFADHALGSDVAVAGNTLAGDQVLPAMLRAFEQPGGLAERLLSALTAGHRAGGDRRGTHSAALKVHSTESYPDVDLRVDWSETPLDDLAAILRRTTESGYADFFASVPRRGRT
jgi:uncharacterized Ntn-hydrolase superfamily protein